MKASAIAYPIQGLIKYHGMRDLKLRLPFHDSISVCTAPFHTHTTIEFSDAFTSDLAEVDGRMASGRELERIQEVVAGAQLRAGSGWRFRMASKSDFPSNIGLGASSSGFAALARASCAALGLSLTDEEMSKIARLGAGSAARSLVGGFAYWKAGDSDETSFAFSLASGEDIPMAILAIPVPAFKSTEDAHAAAVASPLYHARLAYIESALTEMGEAIRTRDVCRIGRAAEIDTLNLHAVTMTGRGGPIYWMPETVAVMREIRRLRTEGRETYFSIDTGATVYVNCSTRDADHVGRAIRAMGLTSVQCSVGGAARVEQRHLF